MKFLSFMFTLAICTILNGYTQVNIKILLIQGYHTTCVSFSCEFINLLAISVYIYIFFLILFFYYSQFVSIHKLFTSLSENIMLYFVNVYVLCIYYTYTSRKHLRTEVSPDLHPNYSKKGGNLGSESK